MRIQICSNKGNVITLFNSNKELKESVENLKMEKVVKILKENNITFLIKYFKHDDKIVDLDGILGYAPTILVSKNVNVLNLASEIIKLKSDENKFSQINKDVNSIFIQIRVSNENEFLMDYFKNNAEDIDVLIVQDNVHDTTYPLLGFSIEKR